MNPLVFVATLFSSFAASALAQPLNCAETFDSANNPHEFYFGVPSVEFPSSGGVSGGHLKVTKLVTFFPYVETRASESCFVGDYAGRHITAVSASLKIFYTEYATQMISAPVALVFWFHAGTPNDIDDDIGFFTLSHNEVSATSQQWESFRFEIPSQATNWPESWRPIARGAQPTTALPSPDKFFSQISEMGFYVGNPEQLTILRGWELGFDDVSLSK